MERLNYVIDKIVSQEEIIQHRALFAMKNQRVVFTNGCFDILHPGHVTYLAKAASLGNKLIVGLNSDESVRGLDKAPNRPINSQDARALVLAALGFIDLVCVFTESTPVKLIELVQPDVLVKGGDYDADETDSSSKKFIVGSEFVKSYGGEVKTIDLVQGFSTTRIIEKLK
ncbi:MAG: D-glycero-beta-D-manno-heptose 1-phosphate adenylyltransferase [Bacteroidota bacterium]